MASIEDLRAELKTLKAAFKATSDLLYNAQCAQYSIKVGDLVGVNDGTYGKPSVKVYAVTRFVFALNREPDIFGRKRLKDEIHFQRGEVLLCFHEGRRPPVIGHLDDSVPNSPER
jgi:hypothetical protein